LAVQLVPLQKLLPRQMLLHGGEPGAHVQVVGQPERVQV
jgi:hypothetical protein